MITNSLNTKEKGIARAIIFKEKEKWKAVCLHFDLIEEADTRKKIEIQMIESMLGYLENVSKNNLDNTLLNRYAEQKYWKKRKKEDVVLEWDESCVKYIKKN